jgi:hypothetical protein
MLTSAIDQALQHLRSAVLLPEGVDLTDARLLECFVSRKSPRRLSGGPVPRSAC